MIYTPPEEREELQSKCSSNDAYSLQTDRSGRPVLAKGKRPKPRPHGEILSSFFQDNFCCSVGKGNSFPMSFDKHALREAKRKFVGINYAVAMVSKHLRFVF